MVLTETEWFWAFSIGLLVLNTFVRPLIPQRLRDLVTKTAAGYVILLGYMNGKYNTEVFGNRVATLIEHWANNGEPFDRIYLIGYSFGSIVLMDTVFRSDDSTVGPLRGVRGVATLGNPYDMTAVLWPEHYRQRTDTFTLAKTWINVRIDGDPISSAFHWSDQPRRGLPSGNGVISPAIELTQRDWNRRSKSGWINQLLLRGIRHSHSAYWDKSPGEAGCLTAVVPSLLQDDPIFDGSPVHAPADYRSA